MKTYTMSVFWWSIIYVLLQKVFFSVRIKIIKLFRENPTSFLKIKHHYHIEHTSSSINEMTHLACMLREKQQAFDKFLVFFVLSSIHFCFTFKLLWLQVEISLNISIVLNRFFLLFLVVTVIRKVKFCNNIVK